MGGLEFQQAFAIVDTSAASRLLVSTSRYSYLSHGEAIRQIEPLRRLLQLAVSTQYRRWKTYKRKLLQLNSGI